MWTAVVTRVVVEVDVDVVVVVVVGGRAAVRPARSMSIASIVSLKL